MGSTETIRDEAAGAGSRAGGVALLVLASVLWSLSGLFVKKVQIDPVVFAFWRALAAGVVVAPLVLAGGRVWPAARLMGLSIGVYTCVVTLLITAMTYSTAAEGILLQYTGPAFCALLAWGVLGRRIRSRTWLAVGIAILGVTIMLIGAEHSRGWKGPTAGVISGMAFGALILVLERINAASGGRANAFFVVAANNLGCAGLLFIWLAGAVRAEAWQIGMVALCGAIQLGIPYVLFQLGLRRVSAVDASLLILLEPVLTPVWVWMGTGEMPDMATVVGGIAILLAMGLEATAADVR